jgi:hypothetical protein
MELPQRNDHGHRSVVTRRRAGLLLIVLVATSLLAIVGSLLWPEPAVGDWYSYSNIAPIRERWWAVLTALSVGLVLNVPAQALAALILTPERGAMWTTAGAASCGWAPVCTPSVVGAGRLCISLGLMPRSTLRVERASSTRLPRTPACSPPALPGAVLVALGTIVQAVGLWRSRALPRWVPILSLAIVLSFITPGNGVVGALLGIPVAVAGIAIGYYAWRRTGPRPFLR